MSETISREEFLAGVSFDADGLVAAIAQDHRTNEILMLAWMNREALRLTLDTGDVTYWSRSRQELWRKGATSGHTQKLVEAYIDCDGDALLFKVEQTGAACHTGNRSCFYRKLGQ
ncbi:MAG TPA: phosphoribosyl-AMP cyclohydrolase [Rhizomicrobium sp.]|nr:phosphoribosyl-AMP cyclohydrolase [Rhizomicrobium sp.]